MGKTLYAYVVQYHHTATVIDSSKIIRQQLFFSTLHGAGETGTTTTTTQSRRFSFVSFVVIIICRTFDYRSQGVVSAFIRIVVVVDVDGPVDNLLLYVADAAEPTAKLAARSRILFFVAERCVVRLCGGALYLTLYIFSVCCYCYKINSKTEHYFIISVKIFFTILCVCSAYHFYHFLTFILSELVSFSGINYVVHT